VEKLGLSYHNVHALHKKVDSLPEKAGKWIVSQLKFPDSPSDTYIIRYRDPVEAIKSLWKDPELSLKILKKCSLTKTKVTAYTQKCGLGSDGTFCRYVTFYTTTRIKENLGYKPRPISPKLNIREPQLPQS